MTEDYRALLEETKEVLDDLSWKIGQLLNKKPQVEKPKDLAQLPFNPKMINWKPMVRGVDGTHWEMASNEANVGNDDYKKLRVFLKDAGGGVRSEGKWYWLWDTGVGRQDEKKGGQKP